MVEISVITHVYINSIARFAELMSLFFSQPNGGNNHLTVSSRYHLKAGEIIIFD